ncbi:uncharacterized protein LOC143037462 [Oratosquilla oratoria]|uniref:uncharacterized protein LOC143037462 n=1 Tax=Oratosquilla oratoria TaxID=337810 RepID=UPI003F776E27
MATTAATRSAVCSLLLQHSRRSASSVATRRFLTSQSEIRKGASAVPLSLEESGPHGQHVIESDLPAVPLVKKDLTSYVLEHVDKWQNKTALECSITGRSYTFAQLRDSVSRFAGALARMGIGPGETVALFSPNTPEYPIAFYGAIMAGTVVTTVSSSFTPEEVSRQLSDSGARMVICHPLLEGVADAALRLHGSPCSVVVTGPSSHGHPNLLEIIADPNIPFADPVEIDVNAPSLLPYSSGTTGAPKGVALSHLSVSTNMEMFLKSKTSSMEEALGDHQEVLMGLLPFYHIYGMLVIMAAGLRSGAKVVTVPKFEPQLYVKNLKEHRISVLQLVPPLLNFMAASPAVAPEDLTSLKTVMCGAAATPAASAQILKEKAPNPIFFQEGFGMTESLCSHMTPAGGERLGWCGKVIGNVKAKVVDLTTGKALPSGMEGELCVYSPTMMTGYHNNPKATAETIDEDGWLRTGDVAIYDDQGYFQIVDRIKELIKVKGLQVSPSELEEILLQHPSVGDVGVVGLEDERCGEVPMAFVVPRAKGVDPKDIMSFVSDRVAPHKQLAGGVRFVSELPKNPTGKLLRRELRKMTKTTN